MFTLLAYLPASRSYEWSRSPVRSTGVPLPAIVMQRSLPLRVSVYSLPSESVAAVPTVRVPSVLPEVFFTVMVLSKPAAFSAST